MAGRPLTRHDVASGEPGEAWPQPPARLSLGREEVHLWRAWLPTEAAPEADLALLSEDERRRAERLRLPIARAQYVAARATVRRLLGRYLGQPPTALRFAYGPQGKPALAASAAASLHFNVSHSHGLGLFAVARRPVGVDVEQVRLGIDTSRVAARFFSPVELAALGAVAAEQRPMAFYRLWTRKEAVLKAAGRGVWQALSQVEVSGPEEPASLVQAGWADDAAPWSLVDLAPAPGFVGALAVAGTGWRLRRWALSSQTLQP